MNRVPSPALNLDGYTDLPVGKVAAVVTYLKMTKRPRLRRLPRPDGWSLVRLDRDIERYRALFRTVGEPWLWFSRAIMAGSDLARILSHPDVEAYALHDGAGDVGFLELDFRPKGECELKFLGVVPDAIGQGAGRFLMNEAIRRAFRRRIRRFFVHTCSLDHPSALGFYVRSGFVPYRRAIEVADDPRLTGHLPIEAAPHVPLLKRPARPRKAKARPSARL